ncbi:cation-translocating P-type ATPase [Corynebacterium comes]|uniref:Calcium-transporting ATPase n=1 Tax=Corynebacterium comes TaxID=2675218 RepID=A0A6B8VT95_9CORY|nr:cation-transporting P-type ATPase [Corynebacterium comes]QGU04574.1 Calcium-transporting ATPase [Corynebacterium comes]
METREQGLTSAEARKRLADTGTNELPGVRRVPVLRRFLSQFTNFFALLLWGAAALALVARIPELAIAVSAVVIINGLFAFAQEERATQAAAKLRGLLPTQVTVVRDGAPTKVPAAEVVPGDVVILAAGDRLPADLTFLSTDSCTADESMLSGESLAVVKEAGDAGFGGTFLANGTAEACVTATGNNTRLAEIASLTSHVVPPPTPLQRELRRVVRTISSVALGFGVTFCIISILVGTPLHNALLFAIGVAVAMIPEGLLPTVTLSLAVGAQRMADRNALVRNLQAVETLGSATFICTDKTGTLTQNRMNVVEVWTPEGMVAVDGEGYSPVAGITGPSSATDPARRLAWAARTASRGRIRRAGEEWIADGDPMEAALDALAHRLAGPVGLSDPEPTRRFAFDPVRRRESVILGAELLVKGAPESMLPLCSNTGLADRASEELTGMANRGLRVLAVASRTLPRGTRVDEAAPEELEHDLVLEGLVGLHDPPRPGVPEAIRQARQAGIRIAMITGDHPVTAAAIARQTGLALGDPVVVEGRDLPPDEESLGELIDHDGVVVSRVSPEQKLAIARALQRRGHVLAMTGDGVNDGPALSEADIGVAMGMTGTDVAREAADLVLLDDNFATIIIAVEQGRATYTNIRRFLTYHLTSNVSELLPFVVWILSGGSFPLALGVLQILALDIGTDLLPALALGGEKPSPDVLRKPPEKRHLMDGALLTRVFVVLGPVQAAFALGIFTLVLWGSGWTWGAQPAPGLLATASGAAFCTVVVGQMANAVACRSATRPAWRINWFSNRMLLVAVLVEVALLLFFLFFAPLAGVLGHAPPPLEGALFSLLVVPTLLSVDGLHKFLRHRRRDNRSRAGSQRPADPPPLKPEG